MFSPQNFHKSKLDKFIKRALTNHSCSSFIVFFTSLDRNCDVKVGRGRHDAKTHVTQIKLRRCGEIPVRVVGDCDVKISQ